MEGSASRFGEGAVNIPLATIRTQDDLIEALRVAKALRGLSNDFCDQRAGLTRGHTDKVLGPTRAKNLSPMTLDTFLEVFAVELHMVVNIEAVKRMEARWEQRAPDRIRLEPNRISQKLVDRANPIVMRQNGKKGGIASVNQRSGSLVEQNRRAGHARARKMTRKERSELARKAGLASAASKAARRREQLQHTLDVGGPASPATEAR